MYSADSRSLEPVSRLLPPPALAVFVKAANEMADNGGDHNDCVQAGWASVKAEGWNRPEHGKRWVRKENPTSVDVHVDTPMNGKKPKKKPSEDNEDDDFPPKTKKGDRFEATAQVCKVDSKLGLVFGWAICCTKNGEPYFDYQGDHIPDETMLKAATEFMLSTPMAGDMHARDDDGEPVQDGKVVFLFPMTKEVAAALEIETPQTGLLIATKPSADVLGKYESGEYTGFSIGGFRGEDEEVEEAA
jgi:hypothetical protein